MNNSGVKYRIVLTIENCPSLYVKGTLSDELVHDLVEEIRVAGKDESMVPLHIQSTLHDAIFEMATRAIRDKKEGK